MKLGDKVELVLGTCLSNDDPKKLGRIKVAAPGYFDRSVMAIEAIPWAYPFSMNAYQSYSTISEGGKVWLLDNKENADEFWYIPYHELNADTKQAINDDVNSDVLFSRNVSGKTIQIYQNNTEGIVIHNGDNIITLPADGGIILKSGGSKISIEGGKIYVGTTDGNKVPIVMGDVVRDILNGISSSFVELFSQASSNPYTASLAPSFQQAAKNISEKLPELLSDNCTLSK